MEACELQRQMEMLLWWRSSGSVEDEEPKRGRLGSSHFLVATQDCLWQWVTIYSGCKSMRERNEERNGFCKCSNT